MPSPLATATIASRSSRWCLEAAASASRSSRNSLSGIPHTHGPRRRGDAEESNPAKGCALDIPLTQGRVQGTDLGWLASLFLARSARLVLYAVQQRGQDRVGGRITD